MNKADLIVYIKELTGNRTISDFVMNAILDEAQHYLSMRLPLFLLRQAEFATWDATTKKAVIPMPKAVYRVAVVPTNGIERTLQRVTPEDIFRLLRTTGAPSFYAILTAQIGPSGGTKPTGEIPVSLGADFNKASVLIAPLEQNQPNVPLKVEASFLQKTPTEMEDNETNVWMDRFPALFAKAGAYVISLRYDNQQKTAVLLDSLERAIDATIKGWADVEFGDVQLKMGG